MKRSTSLALAVGLLLCGTAAAPPPLMTLTLKPSRMDGAKGTGLLQVSLVAQGMDTPAGETLFSLGTFGPSMATAQPVDGLTVTDDAGPAQVAKAEKGSGWIASRALHGTVSIRYSLPLDNTARGPSSNPPTAPRVAGDGFTGSGRQIAPSLKVKAPYRIAIRWDLSGMTPGAAAIFSRGEGDIDLRAGPVSRLNNGFYMAGHVQREPVDPKSAFDAAWLGEPDFDLRAQMVWTHKLHEYMSKFFRDPTEPTYRIFLRPSTVNPGAGVAEPGSFLATYGSNMPEHYFDSLLGHEMTHTWTATDDLGVWYVEGDATYYQVLLAWRAGLATTDQMLTDMNLTADRYYGNAKLRTPYDQLGSRFDPVYYDRGAEYLAVINGKILEQSGGKRSVDDLFRAMVERMRKGEPISEQVWEDMVKAEIGEEGLAITRAMFAGDVMEPDDGAYGPCFKKYRTPIRKFDLGFEVKALPQGGGGTIQSVKPGSEAEKAGFKVGDEVRYSYTTETIVRHPTLTLTAHVTREGKTFDITYLPRGEAVDGVQWKRVDGVPDSACRPHD